MASKFVKNTEDLLRSYNTSVPAAVAPPQSMWDRARVGLGNAAQAVQNVVGLGTPPVQAEAVGGNQGEVTVRDERVRNYLEKLKEASR